MDCFPTRLSHDTLERMYEVALTAGAPFRPLTRLGRMGYGYAIGDRLRQAIDAAEAAGADSAAYAHLYIGWIHHSHQFADEHGHPFANVNAVEDDAVHTAANGIREVFFNDPGHGLVPEDGHGEVA